MADSNLSRDVFAKLSERILHWEYAPGQRLTGLVETTLEAAAIGADVPLGCYPVAVHSVFRSALNLQPGDDNLVTIIDSAALEHPRSIRLGAAADFTALGLEPRAGGRFEAGGIVLERPGGPPLRISLDQAARTAIRPLPAIGQLGAPWHTAVAMLAGLQAQAATDLRIDHLLGPVAAEGILGRKLASAALALGESVRAGALEPARGAMAGLVGLGCGLTPSGDDFLCGFVTAGHCHSDRVHLPFLGEMKRQVLDCLAGTNAISATLLRCAAEGKISGALHDLAQALQGGRDLAGALARLCAFGHSSGMDIATGFLYGLSVWA
jgi:hypothetical protein